MYKRKSLHCIEEVCCSRPRNKTLLRVRKRAILLQLYTGGREHWRTWPTAPRPQRRKPEKICNIHFRRKLSRMPSAFVWSINSYVSDERDGCGCGCVCVCVWGLFVPLHNESSAQSKQPVKTEGLWTLSLWFIVLPFSSQVKLTAQQRSEAVGLFRVEGVTGFVMSDNSTSATATLCRIVILPLFFYEELSVLSIQAIHKTETV